MENRTREAANMTNVEKLQEAGILAKPHKLTPEDVKVIESLSLAEINVWVSIKEKLETVKDPHAKFFI